MDHSIFDDAIRAIVVKHKTWRRVQFEITSDVRAMTIQTREQPPCGGVVLDRDKTRVGLLQTFLG